MYRKGKVLTGQQALAQVPPSKTTSDPGHVLQPRTPPLFSKGNLDLHILPTVAPWMLNFHDLEEEVNAKALYGCQFFPCSGQSFPSKFPFLPSIQGDQLNQISFLFLAQGKNQRWSMWSQVLNIAIGGVAWIF